jgi:hypothetical protein
MIVKTELTNREFHQTMGAEDRGQPTRENDRDQLMVALAQVRPPLSPPLSLVIAVLLALALA